MIKHSTEINAFPLRPCCQVVRLQDDGPPGGGQSTDHGG
jgi:hypothetical protein